MPKKTKAEIREERRLKEKYRPQGGTLAGQKARLKTAKGYTGQKSSDIKIRINEK